MMTLEEKAGYYHEICMKRHVRAPFFVEKCRFPDPANRDVWEPMDDDNDGSYTAFYMAMECLRYAVTGDDQARENANRAFESIEFLHTVTGMDGFIARTAVPSTWTLMADPNEEISPQEAADRRIRDPRYKQVEQRWRLSSDGKWLWKGDTSSDEVTGHFFGYYFFHELAAEGEYKDRVREVTRKLMDHIIRNGYCLLDVDGQPTRWAKWAPEMLRQPDWRSEAPINAFEILSFLKVSGYVTGDDKYEKEYRRLAEEHGYAELARRPKMYGLAERTHIDDELLSMAWPGLLLNEKDPVLLAKYREGVSWAHRTVANEMNPQANFLYALIGGAEFHVDDSIAYLRDSPLDLVQWVVDSAPRDDVRLVRRPMPAPLQTDRMLPPSERGVMRWDKNPWEHISGDFSDAKGRLESSGVHWMFPYWLGRYCSIIAAPEPGLATGER
jgi:hypothetical protein